jgi:DNA polymerase-3 subunit delta'
MLTTTQPGAFLPTIRSRCRMVHLDPLPETAVATLLDKYAPGLPAEERLALCRLSEGSIGKALQFHREKGVALYKELLTAISALPALDIVKAHDLADKLSRSEQGYDAAREIMTGWCQRLARAEARGAMLSDVMPGDAEVFRRIAAAFPPYHFLNTWEKMSQLFQQTETHILDKRQALLGSFLMLQKPDYPSLSI